MTQRRQAPSDRFRNKMLTRTRSFAHITLPVGGAGHGRENVGEFFRGRCEEAIAYYKTKLDAEVLMQMRFKDNPEKPSADKVPREFDQRIMHACVRIAGAELFMSDGMRSGPTDFDCVSLSLNLPTETEAHRIFNALAADGKITMPIGKTFFAQCFGGVTDRFGVQWMVIVQPMP